MASKDPIKRKEANQRWWANNKKAITIRRKTTHKVNIENKKAYMKKYGKQYHLKKKYNLSLAEYNNIMELQNNSCPICKITFDETLQARKPHVDHNHSTGKVREIICNNCNGMIGFAGENTTTLRTAVEYLNKHNSILADYAIGSKGFADYDLAGQYTTSGSLFNSSTNHVIPDTWSGPILKKEANEHAWSYCTNVEVNRNLE